MKHLFSADDTFRVWSTVRAGDTESLVVACPADRIDTGVRSGLWVCDRNTRHLIPSSIDEHRVVILPPGEAQKEWSQVAAILSTALEVGLDRTSTIVALGGGVLCDTAAFAASIYLRGIDVVLIPSTLLAVVDAAIGGKTGINFGGYKNMVGTFHTAREVRIAVDLLDSLPQREYLSGLAELIKAAVLDDDDLLSLLEDRREEVLSRTTDVLEDICRRAVAVKVRVVTEDYREGGRRAILNLGHTFAHALESVSGFGTWTHGAAVAWGIAKACELGVAIGKTPESHARRVIGLLEAYGYTVGSSGESADDLLDAMKHDKKRVGATVRFVLTRGVGSTEVVPVDAETVRRVL